MNSTDVAKIFSDDWPSFVGIVIVAAIWHFLIRRPPDVDRVKQQLGPALNRFADVPHTRLDMALLTAAQAAQSGWRGIASLILTAFCVVSAFFSFLLFRASFPALPRWYGYLPFGLVCGLLGRLVQRIQHRAILQRLEHLHDATDSA